MTTPCRKPGCVADAVADGLCAVHAAGLGATCLACKGTGRLVKANASGKLGSDTCDRCAGAGLKDQCKSNLARREKTVPVSKRGLIVLADEGDL